MSRRAGTSSPLAACSTSTTCCRRRPRTSAPCSASWTSRQRLDGSRRVRGSAAALLQVTLCCAVLCCAVLCCAVLCCAVLCCAVLCCAVLCHVVSQARRLLVAPPSAAARGVSARGVSARLIAHRERGARSGVVSPGLHYPIVCAYQRPALHVRGTVLGVRRVLGLRNARVQPRRCQRCVDEPHAAATCRRPHCVCPQHSVGNACARRVVAGGVA